MCFFKELQWTAAVALFSSRCCFSLKNKCRAFTRLPSTEEGHERQQLLSHILLTGLVLLDWTCAYEQMFTLVDISWWRNAVSFFQISEPSHHWHFRQQVLHAWKKPQSTDGALKWLHRNRMHVRERFNYLDVTFMTNADRREKPEKCAFLLEMSRLENSSSKEWTGDTNTFRLHLMGSSRRLKNHSMKAPLRGTSQITRSSESKVRHRVCETDGSLSFLLLKFNLGRWSWDLYFKVQLPSAAFSPWSMSNPLLLRTVFF